MYSKVHQDVDSSAWRVTCTAGACEATLEESFGVSWRTLWVRGMSAPMAERGSADTENAETDVDYKLTVISRQDGSVVEVTFNASDTYVKLA